MNILYADSDQDDCDFFCEAVREINPSYSCLTASTCDEMLDILEKNTVQPDYIFLDANIANMDGNACLQQIKKNPLLQGIPVIMTSSIGDAKRINEYKKIGAAHFFVKPSNFSELQRLIEIAITNVKKQSL